MLIGCVAALVLTPLARLVAIRWGNIDRPVGPKIHTRATPLMGGVAVYLGFAAAAVLVLPMTPAVRGILVGGLAALAIGLLDERFSLSPSLHLGGQVAAAGIAMAAGVGIVRSISSPFAGLTSPAIEVPALVGAGFTLFWLVGMMNTMNFLDGMDGLVAGVAALAALLLAVWASEPGRFFLLPSAHHEDLILPVALAGALFGFLPYNWHVARIFIGDSGTMFLGLALGALSIVGPAKLGTALLVLLIPVLDVAWAIVRRRLSGRSFLSGDKQHVYHRMLDYGLGYTTTVLVMYGLCLALAVLDLELVKLAKLLAFVVLAAVTGASFVALEVRASQRGGRRLFGEGANRLEDNQRVQPAGQDVGQPVLSQIQDDE